ncbi:SGNH/GDSL hydrolase family protein [Nonomuraea sp. SMC257]|uniref:SGNH/GDSL hydrolase family protein n=1 Tax=Nonomuraea montanisoli TaxID=2741721 RepID=A0A7Y6M113_9ACTN|nr:GDSL-type esterase/lipase family protein [Nonomuraea montanisoli]NUW29945.1 SGNH/GDSL hydrolase family protein [Nonomuraea montanisoli]
MKPPRWAVALSAAVAVMAATVPAAPAMAATGPTAAADASPARWTAAWGAAMQRPTPGTADNGPNWSVKGFDDHTLRQVVRMTVAGSHVRIRLSNVYGTRPLAIAGARVGRSAGGAMVWPDSSRPVTFAGKPSAAIPPGKELVSDPVALTVSPLERLAVSVRVHGATGPATFHRFTTATSYRAHGDHLGDANAGAFGEATSAWYYLTGVEVDNPAATVVAFGDSLVDGVGSSAGADVRFVDQLAERLGTGDRPLATVNAGIAGNSLLSGSPCYGDRATDRFRRDVLDRPGVRAVIVHLGANDLGLPQVGGACVGSAGKVTLQRLIDGHRALIEAAHARGVKAVGVTIPPLRGALFPFWNEEVEKARIGLNRWIRSGGAYDAVLDADRAMADPAAAGRSRPGYLFIDGLHPDDAGHHAIAAALDLGATTGWER